MAHESPQRDVCSVGGERRFIEAARHDAEGLHRNQPAKPSLLNEGALPGYDVVRELSRGGQGAVYEAFQRCTKRKVAIKVMLAGPQASEAARRRFEREIKLLAQLRHPNIVVIHDGGVAEGHSYFVMDYIAGEHLHHYCQSHALDCGGMVRLWRQVVDAVAFAHRRGVVHRDLKPANILVDQNGTPYVLDFGLAKIVSRSQDDPTTVVSRTGDVLGTPRYMSPEQRLGDLDSVDTRTDVHALGVILFELVTGLHPSEMKSNNLGRGMTDKPGEPLGLPELRAGVGPGLERILLKAMSSDPGHRYPSAVEMLKDVDAWLNQCGDKPYSSYRRCWPLLVASTILGAVVWCAFHGMPRFGHNALRASTAQLGADTTPAGSARSSEPGSATRVSDERLSAALEYARRNLPLRSVEVEPVPGEKGIRIKGWVLNRSEMDTLRGRAQPISDRVQMETHIDPEAVRLLVQRALTEAGAQEVKVRLGGVRGQEHLSIEFLRTGEEGRFIQLAKCYVFDGANVRHRAH